MTDTVPARSSVEREQREKIPQDEKVIPPGGEIKNRRRSSNLFDSDGIGFQMRPNLHEKFNHLKVEEAIEITIKDFMLGKQYSSEEANGWSTELATLIRTKIKELNFPRYKLVTMVTMGEQIGGGIHIGMKCLWDADTDVYANFSYMTDKIFVIGTVCGVFYY